MKTKIMFLVSIVLFISLVVAGTAFAQPGLPQPPPQAPLGGLSLLVIAGGFFGIYKLRSKK